MSKSSCFVAFKRLKDWIWRNKTQNTGVPVMVISLSSLYLQITLTPEPQISFPNLRHRLCPQLDKQFPVSWSLIWDSALKVACYFNIGTAVTTKASVWAHLKGLNDSFIIPYLSTLFYPVLPSPSFLVVFHHCLLQLTSCISFVLFDLECPFACTLRKSVRCLNTDRYTDNLV